MKEKIRGRAERSLGGGSGDGRLEKLPPGGSGSQPVPVKYSWLIGKLHDTTVHTRITVPQKQPKPSSPSGHTAYFALRWFP